MFSERGKDRRKEGGKVREGGREGRKNKGRKRKKRKGKGRKGKKRKRKKEKTQIMRPIHLSH